MSDRDTRFSNESIQSVKELPEQPLLTQQTTTEPEPLITQKQTRLTTLGTNFNRMQNKVKRMHLFSSFCESPADVSFQTQEEDEKVLLFLRKSMVMNLPWIFASLILAVLPILLYFLKDTLLAFTPPLSFIFILIPVYYITVALYAFVNFITWYYNVALITTKRVIDVDFHQLVMKDIAETKLALVQDVSYRQVGVLENLFGFGHVLIQTAGTVENFEFYQLPQPARVVEIVEGLIGGRRLYEP